MTDEFYSVAVPEQRQILGLPLRPLSLGHLILLHRVKSAFVCEGTVNYNELAIAALICSLTYNDGLACLKDPGTADFLKLLGERITGIREWRVRLGICKPRVIDLPANTVAFYDYLKDGNSTPYYSFKSDDFNPVCLPSIQIVKVSLMRDMHFTEEQIFDRSWAMCLWDYFTLKAVKGEVSIEDKDLMFEAQKTGERVAEMIRAGKLTAK